MITKALPNIGSEFTPSELFHVLIKLYKGQPYPDKKALGSIGGASNGGSIKLIDGKFVRIK
ncbi:MAG: hypothetical protein UHK60_07295 [Acutalibacteraceae bacterium]|nr:hypothetical protein [Acutalibacteraceae bacterium]